ncbi:MAG: Uma2 family endonuclease [candidate division NC10 bacterium]
MLARLLPRALCRFLHYEPEAGGAVHGYDRTMKARRFAALNVPHLWLVDPDARRIECHRREGADYRLVVSADAPDTLAHPDFPVLAIPLAPLWE